MSPVNESELHIMEPPSGYEFIPNVSRWEQRMFGCSIMIEGINISSRILSVTTINTRDYLAGLLLMSNLYSLVLPDKPIITFRVFDTRNPVNYELVSPLFGFPLFDLPVELTTQITTYHPRDWYLVSKDINQLVSGDMILDTSIKYEIRMKGALIMMSKYGNLSRHQIACLLKLINSSISISNLLPILENLRDGMELLMQTITDKGLEKKKIVAYFNSSEVIRASSLEYIKWLLHNYDDLYYAHNIVVAELFLKSDRIVSRSSKFVYLFVNRVIKTKNTNAILTLTEGAEDNDLYTLATDIQSNLGTIVKNNTNPFTGLTRQSYESSPIEIDIAACLRNILEIVSENFRTNSGGLLAFKKTIIYLYLYTSSSSDRHKIVTLFSSLSKDITTAEIVDCLNYMLEADSSYYSHELFLILLERLNLNINNSELSEVSFIEEASMMIDSFEKFLINKAVGDDYFVVRLTKRMSKISNVMARTVEILPKGETRNRYQRLVDYLASLFAQSV
jgi:hypothetical protein